MEEKARLLINSLALTGQSEFYKDSPSDMDDSLIESYIWRKIVLKILISIKFPAELYQICHTLACMSDDKLEELLK